ncbi:MAG: hypothetical protein K0R54_2074 [Clostridiaceae bacterium]|jgi:hypothetical protein|nr:hypothetical protein [Clostridiaceae bacterium]
MSNVNANINLNCRCSFEPIFERPPLGLKPRRICLEERIAEIQNAINRYVEARKPIPKEWTEELSEQINKLNIEYEKHDYKYISFVEYGTHR